MTNDNFRFVAGEPVYDADHWDPWADPARLMPVEAFAGSGGGVVEPTDREAELLTVQSNLTTGLDMLNARLSDDAERNDQIVRTIAFRL